MRLSAATVDALPGSVTRPGHDWVRQDVGIVHLGIGAFARAHLATYTDAAMAAGDGDWAIAGISMRAPGVRDALAPQDTLYTVTERGPVGTSTRLVGALRDVVVASESPARAAALLAAPATRIVTLTVTEKGYHRRPDGTLDIAAVERDGATLYHHLARGLAARAAAGRGGVTLLSCDNLANNGGALRTTLGAWLDHAAPRTRAWFDRECSCPATMVDRIVPAPSSPDLDAVAATIGLRDAGAIVTEPFRQWVIEDRFAGPRPQWDAAGAQFVADVAPYEAAKLRMLNGAHSALAYLGLLAGLAHVHQAVADPAIRRVVERLMLDEASASLSPTPEQDLAAYAEALVARFANPALPHRLAQIATDGSQKIAARWLEPLSINAQQGRTCPATLRALAAWLLHVRGRGAPVADPLADQLAATWRQAGQGAIVDALFGARGLYPGWHPTQADRAILQTELAALERETERRELRT